MIMEFIKRLFVPGAWLMRRLHLSGKLVVLMLVMLAAVGAMEFLASWVGWLGLLVLLYLMISFYFSFMADLRRVIRFLELTAEGNLRERIESRGRDEIADMAMSLKRMVGSLSAMVASIRSNSALVTHAGKSLTTGNREMSERTEQQAANLEQTAASVEELSSTVQDNTQTAQQANTQAGLVRDVADRGAQAMAQAVQSVEATQNSAKRMNEIIGVIDGLAFQTNILALNAAVEAARAGEAGRGFAVVATEVRSLAQRSAESAKEIRQLISASSEQVASSVAQIRALGANMTEILSGIRGVATSMSQISTSSVEQSAGLSEVASAVRQLDEITQRNAQMVERAVTQAVTLEHRASTLAEAVQAFQLQQGTADEALGLVERAIAYREQTTRDSFLRGLTDPQLGFFDRDMYVFALDSEGTYRAFGGNPAKVGTRVQDIPGIDGQGLLDAIVSQASHEPGWVEYDITNPATGAVQTKMSYVQQVDDVYVGCGVYKNLVTG
jgi:methyl-accepting chemotaxis protein